MIATLDGSRWTVLVSGEDTGRRFAVVETFACRGAEPPRHMHSREDEFVYVLEGRVTFCRDGEPFDGPAGAWLFLPRGSEHTFAVESAYARLLVIVAPAGLEDSLDELDQSAPAADLLSVERLVAAAARYGVAITGPGTGKGEHAQREPAHRQG